MQLNLPIPSSWADRILTLILGLVGGGTLFKIIQLIVNKQKRISDVAIDNATAENLRVDALAKYQQLLSTLQDRLNHVEAQSDQRETDCREQVHFLQTSLSYNRQMLSTYIKRGHEFAGEVAKLVLYLRNRDVSAATAVEKLKQCSSGGKVEPAEVTDIVLLITPPEFRIRTGDEISRLYPLPKPPDGIDSGEFPR